MMDGGRVRFRVIACMMFLLVCQLGYLAAGVKTGLAGFADFRAFYGAGAIVRMGAGARLYEYELQHQVQNERVGERTAALPFVYPGYAALPFAAVTGLGYRTAYWVFLGVNVVLLGVAVWLMLPWLQGLTAVWRGLPWMVFGCFYPVAVALLQGQVSVALLVIVCGCFAAMERGRMFLAGAVLALGLVKFHVVLPVALLFCWWRRWRFVGGFAAGAAGVGLACLWVTGWAGMVSYARLVVTAAGTGSVGAALDDSMRNSGRMPNLHGLVFAMAGDARWGTVVVGVLSVGVLVWTARQGASLGAGGGGGATGELSPASARCESAAAAFGAGAQWDESGAGTEFVGAGGDGVLDGVAGVGVGGGNGVEFCAGSDYDSVFGAVGAG